MPINVLLCRGNTACVYLSLLTFPLLSDKLIVCPNMKG